MKTIENKPIKYTVKVPKQDLTGWEDKEKTSDYFDLIEESCNRAAGQGGFTYDEIKNIDRVKKAVENHKVTATSVEDSDYEFIKSRVETRTWPSSSISIVDFIDYIKNIK